MESIWSYLHRNEYLIYCRQTNHRKGIHNQSYEYLFDFITVLTLPIPCISESCIEIKIKEKLIKIFLFTLLCGAPESLMKAFKAFIKPFEAPQRSVKIKIQLNFFSSSRIGTGRVNVEHQTRVISK